MPTRVFSQEPDLIGALPKVMAHARRFFAAELEVLSASPPERPDSAQAFVNVRFESARYPGSGSFHIESRSTVPDDRFAAEAAEARGRAGGMALLAARCPALWTITVEGEASGSAELQLSALLASVALGPVLPEDESTLYGVRGAMERAEKASSKA
ncbi:MAG TPA: hypothetical protein VNG33_15395 [Polyangiaceae bacterium]|nr:hypothetical protein [Polyangiaceae bacterium]